jgi:hypothetical protein
VNRGTLTRWLTLGRLDARRLPDGRLVLRRADVEQLQRENIAALRRRH